MNICYPIEWNEFDHFERPAKGWLSDVVVTLDDGSIHSLNFYDPCRLQQEHDDQIRSGKFGVIEKGLMIVPSVTKENIERAVMQAIKEGYFVR